jgi:ribosomal protein S18 acetylase RimI-like enzyme
MTLPTVTELEHASHTAVPAPRTGFDGPFLVRAFLGGTGRANAASALHAAPDPELGVRLARIEAHYARLGLPARFRSTPLDPPGLDAALRARGYAPDEGSLVMAGPIGAAAADPAVTALEAPDGDWLAVVGTVDYQTTARRQEKVQAAAMLLVPAAWMLLRLDGRPAATAQVVADGPLAGLFDVAVHPEFRRRGLAGRVLGAALAWARGRGAEAAWLQVSAGNAPAVALYRGMGLREVYRYRYYLRM